MSDGAPIDEMVTTVNSAVLGPLAAAVTSILITTGESEAWSVAVDVLEGLLDADSAIGLEVLHDDRAVARATASLPLRLDDEFPVAPDSQLAYVASRSEVVTSPDLDWEDRFVAGAVLTRCGIRSSISARFPLGDGWGVLGTYWITTDGCVSVDSQVFELVVRIAGSHIAHLRRQSGLEVSARRDALTGVWNREASMRELAGRLSTAHPPIVLIIDLDGFKSVNDDLGHQAGDIVLKAIAARIERGVPVGQHVGRLGGDEFIVLLDDDLSSTMRLSERLVGAIEEAISVEGRVVQISASIGVARADDDEDATSLIGRADAAMYAAKSSGRGQVKLSEDRRRRRRLQVGRSNLRPRPAEPHTPMNLVVVDKAISGLRIVVQPIVDVQTGRVRGVEALTRGPVGHRLEYPDHLFSTAATFGRLAELELEAKRRAFALPLPTDVVLFINLEPILMADPGWLDSMQSVWSAAALDRPVVAEITERAVLASPGRLLSAVTACRRLGWRIALDDVGARAESLAALRWIRPDVVKLDTGLIHGQNATHTTQVAAAVAAYRDAAPSTEVVAEGVENDRHLLLTSLLGADLLQGYLIGRPSPVDEVDFSVRPSLRAFADRSVDSSERIGTKRDLLGLSRHIESVALTSDTVLLAALQRDEFLSVPTRRQYAAIARRCGFVGLLGENLTTAAGSSMPGAHIADLTHDDPLTRRWQVVAISPTTSIALVATELDNDGAVDDMDRLFRYRFVTERAAVDEAARELLHYF